MGRGGVVPFGILLARGPRASDINPFFEIDDTVLSPAAPKRSISQRIFYASITPAYHQTIWFRVPFEAVFLSLVGAIYRYSLQQSTSAWASRPTSGRASPAHLHDTLSQSFHGLIFHFRAARNLVHRRLEEAV
jgi:hypothetical protein